MNNGRRCPACQKDIGFWPVFWALWPTRVKCQHCKSVLRYDINVWRTCFTLACPMAVVLVVLPLLLMRRIFGELDARLWALALVLTLVLWAIFEVINALYWRKHKILRIVRSADEFRKP